MRGFPFVSEVFFFRESYELIHVEDHAAHCRMASLIIIIIMKRCTLLISSFALLILISLAIRQRAA